MADIRENREEGNFVDHMTYKDHTNGRLTASMKKEAADNAAHDKARQFAVTIFGREHAHRFDREQDAQDCADKIGGKVVDTW